MKKILAILATFGFAITAAFANIELSANLVFAPVYSQTNKSTTDGITLESDSKYVCPVGEEVKANFFFYSSKHFDVGLNVGEQVLVYTKDTELDTEYDLGYNASFIIGPAFRFNINNNNGIFVSPGLAFNIDYLLKEGTGNSAAIKFGCDVGFNIDAGYRLWLLNKDAFHFGIDAGVQYTVSAGAGSISSLDNGSEVESYDYNIDLANRFKVYLGVVCNFGDRGWDK